MLIGIILNRYNLIITIKLYQLLILCCLFDLFVLELYYVELYTFNMLLNIIMKSSVFVFYINGVSIIVACFI